MASSDRIPNVSPFPNLLGLLEEVERCAAPDLAPLRSAAPPREGGGSFARLCAIASHLSPPAPPEVSIRQIRADAQPAVAPLPQPEPPAAREFAPPEELEETRLILVTPDMLVDEIILTNAPPAGEEIAAAPASLPEPEAIISAAEPEPPNSPHPGGLEGFGFLGACAHSDDAMVSVEEPARAFSAPSSADLAAALGEIPDEKLRERGVGLVLGGAGLIALAVVVACFIPGPVVDYLQSRQDRSPDQEWRRNFAAAWAWLLGLPVFGLITAGLGSLLRRRWALPVVHAGGWLMAISILMMLAVASAGFFFIAPPAFTDKAMLREILRGIGWAAAFGVALPLVYIAIYQRRHLPRVCHLVDPRPRWSDALTEPAVMLWLACLAMAVLAGTLFFLGLFPVCGTFVTGEAARVLSAATVALSVIAALLVSWRQKAGWWLSFFVFTALMLSTVWSLVETPWEQVQALLGRRPGSGAQLPGKLAALLAATIYAPLSMVLLMSRSSFHTEEELEVPSAETAA